MISFNDFTDPATGLVDWDAYSAAKVAAGEICRTCQQYLDYGTAGPGSPRECHQCKRAATHPGDTLRHDNSVRCPACGHLYKPDDFDLSALVAESEAELTCPACGHEFEARASVEVNWTSPPRLPAADPTPPVGA